MYLLLLIIGEGVVYLGLVYGFSIFFEKAKRHNIKTKLSSILIIMASSSTAIIISNLIPNEALGNRFQHSIGGGFIGLLICFLAAKDSAVKINRLQFAVFSFLITITLGTFNENAEFYLQNYWYETLYLVFSRTVNDTWLDLVSNAVGAILGVICFVPFFPERKK
ncbi:MAG: hypothetical protein WCV88_02395 [Patescibacteria group bacterium]|jgi:hypothetical protein